MTATATLAFPGLALPINLRRRETCHPSIGSPPIANLPNTSTTRRRAFSLRLVGDDARYAERPGRTSPPFPGHDMVPGQRPREDWFPRLFDRTSA